MPRDQPSGMGTVVVVVEPSLVAESVMVMVMAFMVSCFCSLVGCFGEAKMAGRMNSDNIAIQTKMAGRGECVANHSLFCFDHEMRAVGSGY